MTNKPKIAGTAWERANEVFLKPWWPKVKKLRTEGTKDIGDLSHPENWAVECKTAKSINLPAFLREAEDEAANKGAQFFVALVKNRRSKGESGSVEDGYAVTRTRVWAIVAFEHEQAIATLNHILALRQRRNDGALTDSSFAVLVDEALMSHVGLMHQTALRVKGTDGETTD